MPQTLDGPMRASVEAKLRQAVTLHEQSRLGEAARHYEDVLRLDPGNFDALHLLGVIAFQMQQPRRSVELIAQAIAIRPDIAEAHCSLGNTLTALMRHNEARVCYERAIALKPSDAVLHNNQGIALANLMRPEEALRSFDRAIALQPNYAEAHNSRGNVLLMLSRHMEALRSFDRAIALVPDYAGAHNNRGIALINLMRLEEALRSFDRAIALQPDYAEAHNSRGNTLQALLRHEEALQSFDKAIGLIPDYVMAHYNRGNALNALERPDDVLAAYEKVFALDPNFPFLLGDMIHTKMKLCDWNNLDAQIAQAVEKINRSESVSQPYPALAAIGSPQTQRKAAEIYTSVRFPPSNALGAIARHKRPEKIRIGYFSADFHDHAVAHLMAELIERHDKSRFELTAFSFGPDKSDDMRLRLSAAFQRFLDVRNRSGEEVAMLARQLEIDIAVDLTGYTQHTRQDIFANRAAPIQVNYLGYPGTTGAAYIDYLIADHALIPETDVEHYSEKIVYLPDCYQPNDTKREIANRVFSRTDLGLPEDAFVFCCFNANHKIAPAVFGRWMSILRTVERGVLWLLEISKTASSNLRKEAARRGVDPGRLIFAPRMPSPEHLARHRAADLFLDTLPYNAHTTASDALWAGLPVLTQRGQTFAARVAASLLCAIDLPELVTTNPEAYEMLAVDLASNPEKLAGIKRKLAANRLTAPLFNIARFTQHIEAAYAAMFDRYQAGLPPDCIDLPRVDWRKEV